MIEERGQITIEALLILGVFILILISVSLPTTFDAVDATRDVRVVSDARFVSEQIVAAANRITNSYEKDTVKIYVPGYSSPGNTPAGYPLIWIRTCIRTDGDVLNTTVLTTRYNEDGSINRNEVYSFTKDLPGDDWGLYIPNTTGSKPIYEEDGFSYTLEISWKNITSKTNAEWIVNNCTSTGIAGRTAGGR